MKKVCQMVVPETIDTVVTHTCFCGAKIVVGFEGSDFCMAHDVPACDRFMKDEPPEQFLEALRLHCPGFIEPKSPPTGVSHGRS